MKLICPPSPLVGGHKNMNYPALLSPITENQTVPFFVLWLAFIYLFVFQNFCCGLRNTIMCIHFPPFWGAGAAAKWLISYTILFETHNILWVRVQSYWSRRKYSTVRVQRNWVPVWLFLLSNKLHNPSKTWFFPFQNNLKWIFGIVLASYSRIS